MGQHPTSNTSDAQRGEVLGPICGVPGQVVSGRFHIYEYACRDLDLRDPGNFTLFMGSTEWVP